MLSIFFQVALSIPDESAFADKLLQWSVFEADNKLQSEAGEHAIASVLNKRVEGRDIFLTCRGTVSSSDLNFRIRGLPVR